MMVVRRAVVLALAAATLATGLAAPSLSAPAPITIAAQPADLLRDRRLTLYGTIPSSRLKEIVVLEARDCGQSLYRQVARVETAAGGRWVWPYFSPGISASIRATWNGRRSMPVRVRDRAYVELRHAGGRGFSFSVRGKMSFEGRRVQLQRLDPARGWTTVKSARLTSRRRAARLDLCLLDSAAHCVRPGRIACTRALPSGAGSGRAISRGARTCCG